MAELERLRSLQDINKEKINSLDNELEEKTKQLKKAQIELEQVKDDNTSGNTVEEIESIKNQ